MSEQPNTQKDIVPADYAPLIAYGNRATVREMAYRVKSLVAGGKRLNDDEAIALAQYAVATGLNPFIGECYYMPGIGPIPGVSGWRKKADEQLEYERKQARSPFARWWVDFVEPSTSETEVMDIHPGDIPIKAILHDTLSKSDWERRKLGAMVEFIKAGLKEGASELADSLVGPEPTWTAVGIVKATENFGGDKMPRYERACKRAEKAAIKKRFPRVNLPEPNKMETGDQIIDTEWQEPVLLTDPAKAIAEMY